jgi:hypothetical protein
VTNLATDLSDSAREVAAQATETSALTTHADHLYTRGFPHATSKVLEDNTTNHHLVLTTIESVGGHKHLIKLNCSHFKEIRRDALESALSQHDWSGIYAIKDVEEVHKFVVDGIIAALDVVAPVKEFVVKTRSQERCQPSCQAGQTCQQR